MGYIGISFKKPIMRGTALPDLFVGFPLNEYDWYIDEAGELRNREIRGGYYSGEEFSQFLKCENQIATIRILCFPKGAIIQDIQNYEDYKNSNCAFVLLIADCHYYEVYSKNRDYLTRIESVCKLEGFDYELTTEENDERYTFHI